MGRKVDCHFPKLKLSVANDKNTHQTGINRKREREEKKKGGTKGERRRSLFPECKGRNIKLRANYLHGSELTPYLSLCHAPCFTDHSIL